jgi:transglutaminase-like putative cysteine protease
MDLQAYLQPSEIIDWQHPEILTLADRLANPCQTTTEIAKACFEYVRDEIHHSWDYQMNPVTYRASDVLQHQTGYCFAKSHLLAALLRANQIPAGLCYQRLSLDDIGAPYTLHGLNAVLLPEVGWYRMDARGNKPGVEAQFSPPQEKLAFQLKLPQETDFIDVFAEPLPLVLQALQQSQTWQEVLLYLPDIAPELWLASQPKGTTTFSL